MKVELISSWMTPLGTIKPKGTILEIDPINFNTRVHKEIKKKTTKKIKK